MWKIIVIKSNHSWPVFIQLSKSRRHGIIWNNLLNWGNTNSTCHASNRKCLIIYHGFTMLIYKAYLKFLLRKVMGWSLSTNLNELRHWLTPTYLWDIHREKVDFMGHCFHMERFLWSAEMVFDVVGVLRPLYWYTWSVM